MWWCWAPGAGGMYGAIVAQENGLTPIVLEKQPEATAGGDLRVSGGYLLPIATDPELMVGSASFGEANEEWADAVDELGTEAIDWVIDHGCEWANGVEYMQVEGGGVAIYECLRDNMVDAGIECLYETPAVKLITNAAGEVIGVTGESAGQQINVKAKQGVLVATGSYTMNKELMANFHIPGIEYYPTGSPYLTGDGLIMAGDLGAKLSRLAMGVEYNGLCSKGASEEVGLAVTAQHRPGRHHREPGRQPLHERAGFPAAQQVHHALLQVPGHHDGVPQRPVRLREQQDVRDFRSGHL